MTNQQQTQNKTDSLNDGWIISIPEHITLTALNSNTLSFEGPLGKQLLNIRLFLRWIHVQLIHNSNRPNQISFSYRRRLEQQVCRIPKPFVGTELNQTSSKKSLKGTRTRESFSSIFKKRELLEGLGNTLQNSINQILKGIEAGFLVQLEIRGVGYRVTVNTPVLITKNNADIQDIPKVIQLRLGFCHDIEIAVPKGIKAFSTRPTLLNLWGLNLQQVRQFAATIRAIRGPENYKGKGIRWYQENVLLKPGKKK